MQHKNKGEGGERIVEKKSQTSLKSKFLQYAQNNKVGQRKLKKGGGGKGKKLKNNNKILFFKKSA